MVPVIPVIPVALFPPAVRATPAAAAAMAVIAPALKPPPEADIVASVAPAPPAVIATLLSCWKVAANCGRREVPEIKLAKVSAELIMANVPGPA